MLFYNHTRFDRRPGGHKRVENLLHRSAIVTHDSALSEISAPSTPASTDEGTSLRGTLPHPHWATDREHQTETNVKTKRVRPEISHPVLSSFRQRFPHGVNWYNVIWMVGMNAAAISAFWHFSWVGLAIAVVMHWVTACLGVTLGYHRLLTHGSFVVSTPVKYFFSICGMLAAEGSPLFWVATHRKHHVLSDQEGDPHTPNDGFWWSHMLWFKPKEGPGELEALLKRWAPDMYKDPVQRFFHKFFPVVPMIFGTMLYFGGEYFFGLGLSCLLWGLCLRMVVGYHSTWFVNSATHIWGYRNYETTDRSRNLWWVAFLSYGEGWHNNHHAHQRLARHGHKPWEIDITYMMIRVLKALGLATQVQDRLPQTDQAA